MREIKLEEYKQIVKGCLAEFHRVCIENGLRYTIAFGTLLGAVRHKGFIPWDDDVDVIMPRDDYEKFVKICRQCLNPDYKLLSIETEPKYTAPLAKMINARTVLKQHRIADGTELGAYIDIFVYDNVSDNEFIRKLEYKFTKLCIKFWGYCVGDRHVKAQGIKAKIKRLIFSGDGRFWSCLMNKAARLNMNKKTRLIGNLMFGVSKNRTKYELPADSFDNIIDIGFEDITVKALSSYDKVLTKSYGDYMTLPPIEQRQGHHHYTVYWRN